ncbi:hypothetical protein F4859DRAFT_505436 [Xylaria cf. heliscus]|nr:hypothetical protein F4859DRAFT_505436 [Xylaria cf. heliscus]
MENPEASNSCIICNKPNSLRCGRCKNVSYCSKLCQRGDYPIHKLLCASFSAFDITTRPTQEHFRAILFPVHKNKPEFIWLHCEWVDIEDEKYQMPNDEPFLNEKGATKYPIQYNLVLGRRLSNTVYVSYRDAFLFDGSAPNDSIKSITGTVPGYHHDWRGPVIGYGKAGPELDPYEYRDVDMEDFRHIADHFITYATDLTSSTRSMFQESLTKIKGVKINCLGDRKMFHRPQFEEIELSPRDSIFTEHDTSDVATRIGLPIFTKRCFPHPNWVNVDCDYFGNHSPYNNQDATFLHLCCDPKAEFSFIQGIWGWGWVPKQWQGLVGSVIVVRQDKKPLSPWHMEGLCRYCRYHVRALLGHSIGEYSPEEPMSRNQVLSMICRPTFYICWSNMVLEKTRNGEVCDVPSPYDV